MGGSWKRLLLQWVIPVVIFTVVLVFSYASVTADVKQDTIVSYEKEMNSATDRYAAKISDSLEKVKAAARVGVGGVAGSTNRAADIASILNGVVTNTDAYKSIWINAEGYALSESGERFDLSGAPYFNDIYFAQGGTSTFVADDGITGNPAIIISEQAPDFNPNDDIETPDFEVFTYYPMNVNMARKLVTVENDYDSSAFTLICDYAGNILLSSNNSNVFNLGDSVWSVLEKGNSAPTLRRMSTKMESGNSGYFHAVVGQEEYFVTFSKIPKSNYALMIGFGKEMVDKNELREYSGIISKMVQPIIIYIIFVLVVTILNIIQIYISNKNTEDLKDMAETDQLTGLKNKLATETEIKEYIAEYPDSLAMMFIVDIDNFKKINDTMGHAFGDEVLRELGRNIGINFRVSDIIGRTGGDEFTIFLKNLKEDANTLREAQKLIYFFKHFQVGDYVKYSVTASIGAAVFPEHGSDFDALYKSADAALYKSKKRGKAQLSFFDDRDKTPEEVAEADAHLIDIERK